MVFIAVCALWLSGLKRVYRLRPKCPDKIGTPECVVLRTLAAVYLWAEKLSKVSRPSALTPWFRPDDRQTRYRTAFMPRGDTEVAENPKASSKLLSRVWWHSGGCWYPPPLLLWHSVKSVGFVPSQDLECTSCSCSWWSGGDNPILPSPLFQAVRCDLCINICSISLWAYILLQHRCV